MRIVGYSLLVLLTALALRAPAQAADITWRNAIAGLFQNPARWQPQQVPGSADRAIFGQNATYTVSFNGSVVNQQALVSQGNVTWTLSGNSYALSGNPGAPFKLGLDVAGAATMLHLRSGPITTSGARVDSQASLLVETGAGLTVNGQSLVVGDFGAADLLVQAGGSLTSDYATLAFEETSTATASVIGATAVWNNNQGATSHPLRVGSGGDASLTVNGGGRVTTGQLIVADLVTSSSMVTLSGVGSSIVANDSVFVGYEGDGHLQVSAGATLQSASGELGSVVGSQGAVTLSNSGSRWDIGGVLNVGLAGEGTIAIASGARVTSQLAILGKQATGFGQAVLDGAGTRWDLSEQLQVGQEGTGVLTLTNGAVVTSLKAASSSGSSGILGAYAIGQGAATISGPGSVWSGDGVLQVGFNGHGELNVSGGGLASHNSVAIGRNSGGQGDATVTGAGSKLKATTFLSVGGSSSTSGGIGTLLVGSGGIAEAGSELTIWTAGQVQLSGGVVQAPVVRVSQGKLLGTGTISGSLINSGLVSVQGAVTPLSVALDYDQAAAATLEIVVGAANPSQLAVAGAAHWDGALRVTTSSGFVPAPGSVFSAATFSSGSGTFNSVQSTFGDQAQQFFELLSGTHSLSLYAPLIGDANFDGLVSGADYTIWADHFGQVGGWAQGDFNGDELISGADYTLWADHFGEMTNLPPASAGMPVPEPTSGAMFGAGWLTAAVLAAARRRRALP